MIDPKAINDAICKCFFLEGEMTVERVKTGEGRLVCGVVRSFVFDPKRLENQREKVEGWLAQLPVEFQEGQSFLNACVISDGTQWGEHPDIEALLCMGEGLGLVELQMPREMWQVMPGGMPYYKIPCAGKEMRRDEAEEEVQ